MLLNLDFVKGYVEKDPYEDDAICFLLDNGEEVQFEGPRYLGDALMALVSTDVNSSWSRQIIITSDEEVMELLAAPWCDDWIDFYA